MWYEKHFNPSNMTWWVYECSPMRCVLVKTFKTEKGADNYIKRHKR